jgi:hypothetical protein
MKKTGIKNASHGLFWALLRQTPGYDDRYRDVIKEGTVHQYSGGKTESLTEMWMKYPADYRRMIEEMKRQAGLPYRRNLQEEALNLARRRVIAAVCAWTEKQGMRFDDRQARIRYAISVACRACSCSDFNAIPESQLTAVYSLFCKKNRVNVDGPSVHRMNRN